MQSNSIYKLYKHNLSLLTDLYQLTMANAYWKTGVHRREAVFHLTYRTNPFKGDYAIACRLDLAIGWLQSLQFSGEDIDYLSSLKGNNEQPLFDPSFLNLLQNFDFQCDIDAIPEGTLVFAHEPLVRVKAGDIERAIEEMKDTGVEMVQSNQLVKAFSN